MKMLAMFGKCLFWLLVVALLIMPLGLLYNISQYEMEAFATPTLPALKQTAMGRILPVLRMDLEEYVLISGKFISRTSVYMPLEFSRPDLIRWEVNAGEEVQEGQLLGTWKDEPIFSEYTGVIETLNNYSSDNAYVKIKLLSPLLLECSVSKSTMDNLRYAPNLTLQDGAALTIDFAAQTQNLDGTYTVRFWVDSDKYSYGECLTEVTAFTGRVYPQVLVVDKSCVYQRTPGEDQPWYVRLVSETGDVLREQEVQVGFGNSMYVSVTGINEGDYCDAGYRLVAEGSVK